ncbi:hypothetical protein [Acinetobacter sp. MB5]|uniref:hypothetical protein n=1 Tax=Acinetobacter sp. MB5 TaxID=2069438 RepID=UPI000DD075AA|nr:hypothetical protein [Acinetobacter sp. MB5]
MEPLSLDEVEFHSFHWDNFDRDILAAHKKVMQHLGLNVKYTEENMPHGEWLDRVIGQSTAKVVAIIEPDLIPLNREIVEKSVQYVYQNDTFLGCAQASNHIHPATHIFASPAFFFITPSCYQALGKPSFMQNKQADVAEQLAYIAEKKGIRYRTLYPTCFEREPREGIWLLGNYGYYGIGTVFADSVYHLFQSRHADNVKLFLQRCDDVLNGCFSTEGFISSTAFNNIGRVVKKPKIKQWYKKIF